MKKNNRQYLDIFKLIVIITMLLIQVFTVYVLIVLFNDIGTYSYVIIEMIAVFIALKILGSSKKYIYKLSWTIFLVIIPVTAIVFYLLYGGQRFIKKVLKREKEISNQLEICKIQNNELVSNIKNNRTLTDVNSIYNLSGYPVYSSVDSQYFKVGEDYFADMMEKLEGATDYILIEFYIFAKGQLYDRIRRILIDKVNAGVEVFLIYDKMGSMARFKAADERELRSHGIQIAPFNKQISKIYRFVNYRTHRKIVIVDGYYTYTGGNNVADEYINIGSKYGHWKDMGIRVDGNSANSFIYAFFKSWMLLTNENIDITRYLNNNKYDVDSSKIVIPFTDEPTNDLEIASHNYMRIITNSTKYVYITTPYLIIDEEMNASLKLAAKSGVDVKIIIPGIADKKFVYEVTLAHCQDLINAGVKIYTYNPGFIHGKTIVSDDLYSTVGSVNFDYRSLMWNYECAMYSSNYDLAMSIKEDFLEELSLSTCINDMYVKKRSILRKVLSGVYKLIGPLL